MFLHPGWYFHYTIIFFSNRFEPKKQHNKYNGVFYVFVIDIISSVSIQLHPASRDFGVQFWFFLQGHEYQWYLRHRKTGIETVPDFNTDFRCFCCIFCLCVPVSSPCINLWKFRMHINPEPVLNPWTTAPKRWAGGYATPCLYYKMQCMPRVSTKCIGCVFIYP